MDDKDLQIDNILEHNEKKPKVNGKSKGDRTELHLCKLLSKHFQEDFSRALGSGSRWSQVSNLPEHAKQTLTGDLCVPEGFLWVIESKGGYEDDINFTNVCDGPINRLNEFIEQVSRDAEYSKRKPIICWKRNRKPWLAIVKGADVLMPLPERYIRYGEWIVVSLEYLLEHTEMEDWFK